MPQKMFALDYASITKKYRSAKGAKVFFFFLVGNIDNVHREDRRKQTMFVEACIYRQKTGNKIYKQMKTNVGKRMRTLEQSRNQRCSHNRQKLIAVANLVFASSTTNFLGTYRATLGTYGATTHQQMIYQRWTERGLKSRRLKLVAEWQRLIQQQIASNAVRIRQNFHFVKVVLLHFFFLSKQFLRQ